MKLSFFLDVNRFITFYQYDLNKEIGYVHRNINAIRSLWDK